MQYTIIRADGRVASKQTSKHHITVLWIYVPSTFWSETSSWRVNMTTCFTFAEMLESAAIESNWSIASSNN